MTSAATVGPPPGRDSGAHGGGLASGYHGTNGSTSNGESVARAASRVMPHVEDLVAIRPDVNRHAPIHKLLSEAETLAKQADTHLDFWRPDLALQEYIKASIITVEIIPRHKDFPELRRGGENQQMWTRLQKRINSQGPKFELVKKTIKENNVKTGVKLLRDGHSSPEPKGNEGPDPSRTTNGPHGNISRDSLDAPTHCDGDASPSRKPPPVQRKPTALHGKTLKHASISSEQPTSPLGEDLSARFARLRGAEILTSTQDPRIRTRPIILPGVAQVLGDSSPSIIDNPAERPLGPRDMPKVPQGHPRPHKLPLDVNLPSMPRPPDAVYSPIRSPDDIPDSRISVNALRSSYSGPSRTNSMLSSSSGPRTSTTIDDRTDYFTPPNTYTTQTTTRAQKRPTSPNLPDSTTVSAEELMKYLKRGSQKLRILLVDLRAREDFDDGHIMAASIVCMEPIVLRKNISGEELVRSMVLSPESEQTLFEKRHEFDLLVYYDQSSESDTQSAKSANDEGAALRDFSRAVYDYSFDETRLKRPPMLLIGGLDAWSDLMGPQALAISKTAHAGSRISRNPLKKPASNGLVRGRPTARKRTYESRPLTKEEESKWDEALKDEEIESPSVSRDVAAESWSYAKSTEDFVRRFPDVVTQESMVVAPKRFEPKPYHKQVSSTPPPIDASHHEELNALMPKPPTRPSPALSRTSYGGISDRDVQNASPVQHNREASSGHNQLGPPAVHTLGNKVAERGKTGLANFKNTCYMNSVLQGISATPFLAWYLIAGDFEKPENKPHRRAGETSDPPQLMARNLANLLKHLWSGNFTFVTPKTFRNYVRAVHRRDRSPKDTFGGDYQQDAAEFLVFVLQLLDDELNTARHKVKGPEPSDEQMTSLVRMPAIHSAVVEWNRFFAYEASPINALFGGQYTVATTCKNCGHCVKRWDTWIDLAVPILDTRMQPLDNALQRHFAPEGLDDYKCEGCNRTGGVVRSQLISRCPTYMIIDLKRATDHKIKTQITFPLDNLDMTPYFVPQDVDMSKRSLAEYKQYIGPFRYQCYAVIQHEGASIDSGHYWTLVRDLKENKWWEMNDSRVLQTSAAKTQTANSYILFYKRV